MCVSEKFPLGCFPPPLSLFSPDGAAFALRNVSYLSHTRKHTHAQRQIPSEIFPYHPCFPVNTHPDRHTQHTLFPVRSSQSTPSHPLSTTKSSFLRLIARSLSQIGPTTERKNRTKKEQWMGEGKKRSG